jgi:hypothetical protein
MDEWEMSNEEMVEFLNEWKAVDRAAADYLEERVPGLTATVDDDESGWLDALVETSRRPRNPTSTRSSSPA